MTNEELKTKEALDYLGFKQLKEVTSKELYYAYLGLSNVYNPETCKKPQYMDGEAFKKLNEYYDYLSSDICRTNEIIRNIIDPAHKTYEYQKNPNIIASKQEEQKASFESSSNPYTNIKPDNIVIKDKPNALNIILAILFPLYGVLNYFIIRRFMPKAARWYLAIGIISFVLNFLVMLI